MRVWSLQPLALAERLARGEALLAAPDFSSWGESPGATWGFRHAYEWMGQRMDAAGILRPCGAQFPFWAWAWWREGGASRPDARSCLPKSGQEPLALLEMEIPRESLLLSDFHLWHHPLNYWPLFPSAGEERLAERSWRRQGVDPYRQKPLPAPQREALEAGWDLIFRLAPLPSGGWEIGDLAPHQRRWLGAERGVPRSVQACFWSLDPQYLVSSRPLLPRRPKKSIETSPAIL